MVEKLEIIEWAFSLGFILEKAWATVTNRSLEGEAKHVVGRRLQGRLM